MRIAELLTAMASWLESPNNEAMMLAETDETCMRVVAESCVLAAELLKKAAEEVDLLEPAAEPMITPESIVETAALATALDSSDDPQLKKMASVLDELLLSIAAPPNAYAERKDLQDARAEALRLKYEQPRKDLHDYNKLGVSEKAIDKSKMTSHYEINGHFLNTRYCPDHPGAQLMRVGQGVFACELDHKQYDFANGYTLNSGEHVPGGDVALRTQGLNTPYHSIFDDREGRLSTNR